MKAKLYLTLGAAIVGVALGGVGCVGHEQTNTQKYEYLTGSYTPQDVQRNGPISNGSSNVRVIDRSDINNSGGAAPAVGRHPIVLRSEARKTERRRQSTTRIRNSGFGLLSALGFRVSVFYCSSS